MEKERWINEHGSAHLKKAYKMGYSCRWLYSCERAARELPGFEPADGDYYWGQADSPSEVALNEAERLIQNGFDAQVVDYGPDPENSNEAILVRLDDFRWIKIIESDAA